MAQRVLVTGATGYIGGRLVPRLLEAGYAVRVLVRSPSKIEEVPWHDEVEIATGDLGDPEAAARACAGVDTFFYLVHSMGSGAGFEQQELQMARTVAEAAARAGVSRIVYLGGLHPEDVELSRHMRSRTAVGRVLLEGAVPAVVFQAGVVIGSGSASFEMIRHLTENLPVMPAPSWVRRRIEPIAVRDVLHYLVHAPELPEGLNRTFDIGSREVLSYAGIMYGYAHEAGIARRRVYSLPIPAPKLAGWWVALTTPIPHSMAVPLVESLQHDAVAAEHDIDRYIPPPEGGLTGYRKAVELALGKLRSDDVETSWTNASHGPPSDPLPSDPEWAGRTVYVDERTRHTDVAPEHVWRVIQGVGAEDGWHSWPEAWAVRGIMDKLAGGVGHTRGRRSSQRLRVGDAVDWWRVEALEDSPEGKVLRLHAEMKIPGRAWLELSALPDGAGTIYRQRAIYFPTGLSGKLYWWLVWPFHGLIFPAMARNIIQRAAAYQSSSMVTKNPVT
ncbi:nucleoside-diphosphate sugar epimerase [Arthrobacter crystallopoietes BAB-32]|uniref:Nucleoside-diphosphate sugar epimerase n=1 Tax=Arthrobacter crystallopoietes BAB-32 TaxID=1246476 RepID=N1V326_9MICC|nr:SDR family oxidoreductase [Arthrobacter crystallopoietes]EMY32648.1 nucleoside-diphosphate sugar epimerase [Arthrobacter crystallopoietes BAB-32]